MCLVICCEYAASTIGAMYMTYIMIKHSPLENNTSEIKTHQGRECIPVKIDEKKKTLARITNFSRLSTYPNLMGIIGKNIRLMLELGYRTAVEATRP